MEAVDIILATFRDLCCVIAYHPLYSVLGCVVLSLGILKFYSRLTVGICYSDQDMTGKTVLITGASAGIGKATAADMARRNARVLMACRNIGKAKRVASEIISYTGNENVIVKFLDLASLKSVRECAEDILKTEKELHVLINNAGIYSNDKSTTEDGYETVMQSNHLGHFLLTLLLLDLLKKSAPSRIINVSSSAYKFGKLNLDDMEGKKCNGQFAKYARSKMVNILFTIELASRLQNSGVTVNALCPGLVKTDIFQNNNSLVAISSKIFQVIAGKTCEEGAQTTIYLAVSSEVANTTGKFFSDCKEEKILPKVQNKTFSERLFEVSKKMNMPTTSSTRGEWTEVNLKNAVVVEEKNMGVNEAANTFSVPKTTLKRRIKTHNFTKGTVIGTGV